MNLDACRATAEELVFEGFGFAALRAAPAPELAAAFALDSLPGIGPLASQARAALVLDCGFSFTHAVPVFDGRAVPAGIRRLNLGGKAVTNLLKEMVSFRSLNVMDETYIMDLVKEAVSFVSRDAPADLRAAREKRSPLAVEYVLPDGVHNLRGYAREPVPRGRHRPGGGPAAAAEEQALALANERFMPMEAVFRPPDIGMEQAGVAELLSQAASGCPPQIAPLLFENVVLVGGAVKCPGFRDRLESELRPLVPQDFELKMNLVPEPDLAAWRGGSRLATSPSFLEGIVTKAEYFEHGGSAARRQAEA
mmetsp:Transcript_25516/g.60699  ORF Transcript_25516/g.60699 Transcript_25516/m.60699 type:complete len:308 (-) Transcript_25516:332-1255(-)